ncbi:methylmalonyl Co-A mutase-associated GTPase MeaB [Rapidithrix thailandica]|uniref:Methylmalonyl Co-A mutase-associated GTPase MeaB n=1 Tax=Rapidithrix thailandica TaxID=413964 RepID=A0AAW9S6W7_9BACT
MKLKKRRLTLEEYVEGVKRGDRFVLSRAITLVESNLEADIQIAQGVLEQLLPFTGRAIRIGITGVPGVGKSTFIETFGQYLLQSGKKIAVLAIDPSSQKTKGSIMGDKTRMEALSNDPRAYIRPSSTGSTVGGVARKTREAMLLCEAAGFDTILIETVGVGQSEVAVKGMVDFFLLLMLAGAGDELQGIKKGIMEMADAIAITKADGKNLEKAKRAKVEYQNALHLFRRSASGWSPRVLTCSALEKTNLDKTWELICKYWEQMHEKGWIAQNRAQQNLYWMKETIQESLVNRFYTHPGIVTKLSEVEAKVASGHVPAYAAAKELLNIYTGNKE